MMVAPGVFLYLVSPFIEALLPLNKQLEEQLELSNRCLLLKTTPHWFQCYFIVEKKNGIIPHRRISFFLHYNLADYYFFFFVPHFKLRTNPIVAVFFSLFLLKQRCAKWLMMCKLKVTTLSVCTSNKLLQGFYFFGRVIQPNGWSYQWWVH